MKPPSADHSSWMQPSLQRRSQRTLQRILDATEELLMDTPFDRLSISDIARRANCSVGAFYGRLRDKEALLQCLDERYCCTMITSLRTACDPARWQDENLAAIVRALIDSMVVLHRAKRGLFRTLILAARTRDDAAFEERTERMNAELTHLVQLLLTRRAEIGHPQPRQAIPFAFLMALSTLREVILFGEGPARVVRHADRRLTDELTAGFLGYLRSPPP